MAVAIVTAIPIHKKLYIIGRTVGDWDTTIIRPYWDNSRDQIRYSSKARVGTYNPVKRAIPQ